MATPTYQVVGLRGGFNYNPLVITSKVGLFGTIQFGYPPAMKLNPLSIARSSITGITVQFGYPPAEQIRLIQLNKNNFNYNFQFFYPSNGKIPGSPIPPAGQLLPRPL